MEGSFNGYSIAVGMFGLVLGMVGLRENQRVLNQNGVSRRSAFLADVAALAVAAVLVAAGVTVIMGAYQTVLGGQGRLLITDLYQVTQLVWHLINFKKVLYTNGLVFYYICIGGHYNGSYI